MKKNKLIFLSILLVIFTSCVSYTRTVIDYPSMDVIVPDRPTLSSIPNDNIQEVIKTYAANQIELMGYAMKLESVVQSLLEYIDLIVDNDSLVLIK